MKKKTTAILLAAAMICSGAAGATVAWLTASSDEVVNTFTLGDINLELTETEPVGRTAKMVPGSTIEKNPTVVVETESESSWVFVKIESEIESVNAKDFLEYEIAEGWTLLEGNIYYREYTSDMTEDVSYPILKDNSVTVKGSVTRKQFEDLDGKKPKLKFTAYAIQKDNITTAADAWNKISSQTTTTP